MNIKILVCLRKLQVKEVKFVNEEKMMFRLIMEEAVKKRPKDIDSQPGQVKEDKRMEEAKVTRKSQGVKKFTTEMIREQVLDYARQLKKVPTRSQLKAKSGYDQDFPSPTTVMRYLGVGWQDKIRHELVKEGIPVPEKIETKPKAASKNPPKKSKKPTVKKVQSKPKPAQAKSIPKPPRPRPAKKPSTAEMTTTVPEWAKELSNKLEMKFDAVVDNHKDVTAQVSDTLQAITSAASSFSKFEATKLLRYDMEGGGSALIYITATK